MNIRTEAMDTHSTAKSAVPWKNRGGWLTGVDVDADGEDENGSEGEEDDGVNEDREATGLEAAELHQPAVARDLEQQPWR